MLLSALPADVDWEAVDAHCDRCLLLAAAGMNFSWYDAKTVLVNLSDAGRMPAAKRVRTKEIWDAERALNEKLAGCMGQVAEGSYSLTRPSKVLADAIATGAARSAVEIYSSLALDDAAAAAIKGAALTRFAEDVLSSAMKRGVDAWWACKRVLAIETDGSTLLRAELADGIILDDPMPLRGAIREALSDAYDRRLPVFAGWQVHRVVDAIEEAARSKK